MTDATPSTEPLSPDAPFCPAGRHERGSPERRTAACMLRRLRAGAETRSRKVRRIRAAIRVGIYENDLKLHIALDRLLGDMV